MSATETAALVSFTERAAEELKRLQQQPDFDPALLLRVGVKGGGCSGLSYVLGFDKKEADDMESEIQGIKVIMKKAHGLYLMGMEIDYAAGLDARGFVFNNPNATSSCGCGESFSV